VKRKQQLKGMRLPGVKALIAIAQTDEDAEVSKRFCGDLRESQLARRGVEALYMFISPLAASEVRANF